MLKRASFKVLNYGKFNWKKDMMYLQFSLQKCQTIFNIYLKIIEIVLIIIQIKYSLTRENYNKL